MKSEVLAICTAYEQGYKVGLKRGMQVSPYQPKGDDVDPYEAWAYGYSEGYRHAVDLIDGEGG